MISPKTFLVILAMGQLYADTNSNTRCVDVSMECDFRQRFCYNRAYSGLMFKMCRATCDWCQMTLDDVLHGSMYFAAPPRIIFQAQSNSTSQGDSENLQQASQAPEPTDCSDVSKHCETASTLCQTPNYQKLMYIKCPKTCGIC